MRKILIMTLFFSISLSQAYVSLDLHSNLEVEALGSSNDDDFDSGAFSIGYDYKLNKDISVGIAYDFKGMEIPDSNSEYQALNLYGKYFTPLNPTTNLFFTLGLCIPQGDFDDYDPGLSYGFGAEISNGVRLSYTLENFSESFSDTELGYFINYDIDATVSRLTVSYSF